MDPPPSIPKYSNIPLVCKLKKALYGLKESPRAWFGRFTKSMKFLVTHKTILINLVSQA